MGSFVFNFHIRSDSAESVSEGLAALMRGEGFEPTDTLTGVADSWPFSGHIRSFYLFEPSGGWVGVLDSDMILSIETAAHLSAALETYAISFHVNDSDSWHYGLTQRGMSLDEFNSPGADPFDPFNAGADDLNSLLGENGLENFQMAIRELEGEFPPPSDDLPSNEAGLKIFSPFESDETHDDRADDNRPPEPGDRSKEHSVDEPESDDTDPELARHLPALKPLLVSGITDRQVLKVLGTRAVFAEQTLGSFLQLVGINPFFAHADFRDMAEEINPKELAMESLALHRRLDFAQQ